MNSMDEEPAQQLPEWWSDFIQRQLARGERESNAFLEARLEELERKTVLERSTQRLP